MVVVDVTTLNQLVRTVDDAGEETQARIIGLSGLDSTDRVAEVGRFLVPEA